MGPNDDIECPYCGANEFSVNEAETPYSASCTQCKKPLNPVQALMGKVCGDCTRKNHAAATKGFDKAYTQARTGK